MTVQEKYEAIRNENITIDVIIPIMAAFHDEILELPENHDKMDDTMVKVINHLYEAWDFIKYCNIVGGTHHSSNNDFFERVDNHDRTDI